MIDFKEYLETIIRTALSQINAELITSTKIILERPKQADHGDFATNVAMQLARVLKRSPRDIAETIVSLLNQGDVRYVDKIEIAGAGFINFFMKQSVQQEIIRKILAEQKAYGAASENSKESVQIEFVSANPTGPLHVGHGRGAAYGASLANLLAAAGYRVRREYYVNDAGRQMDILATSMWLRLLQNNQLDLAFPTNAYQGDYVKEMAAQFQAQNQANLADYLTDTSALFENLPSADADKEGHLDGLIAKAKAFLGAKYTEVHAFVLKEQLDDCRNDLAEFGVEFDCWYSEKSLYDSGKVAEAVQLLEEKGHLYRQDGALWFRSTAFGDEKDRVVQRENGIFTYFASDIAYHLDKFRRGFDRMIDIWGADHHGYIPRVKGALQALDLNAEQLEIALVQFAVLYRNGVKAAMSTRSGEFVTLRELREEVGNDAARFFYVLRKSDQHLDFDLDLAKSKSNENPVYYIQYAHARICSVLAQADLTYDAQTADLTPLATEKHEEAKSHESALMNHLQMYPETIQRAANEFAPHMIAYYLKDLAGLFHRYYNAVPFLNAEDITLKQARLLLLKATAQVLNNGLTLLGVSCPEKM